MKKFTDLFDEPLFENKTTNTIDPYTFAQKIDRILKNSLLFDKASYAADGGEKWIDSRRELFFDRDKAKNKALWDKCAVEAQTDWKFLVWLYQKQGGKF